MKIHGTAHSFDGTDVAVEMQKSRQREARTKVLISKRNRTPAEETELVNLKLSVHGSGQTKADAESNLAQIEAARVAETEQAKKIEATRKAETLEEAADIDYDPAIFDD